MMEGPGADSEEKHEPVSDIETAVVVVGLKALDPEWPIREAIGGGSGNRPHIVNRSRMSQMRYRVSLTNSMSSSCHAGTVICAEGSRPRGEVCASV
jgi:hypothetical protein